MKGTNKINHTTQNFDSRLTQKGPLDFKLYWSYIDEKYFTLKDELSSVIFLSKILQQEEKDFLQKDFKEEVTGVDNALKESQMMKNFTSNTSLNNIFGLNMLGKNRIFEQVKSDIFMCNQNKRNYNETPKPFTSPKKTSNGKNETLQKSPKMIKDEIEYIENILNQSNIRKYLHYIDKSIATQQKSEFHDQKKIHLLNIERQILDLQLSQFAESIIHVYKNSSMKYRLEMDSSDNLPNIELSHELYTKFTTLRDTSNFILSYDKALKSHISHGNEKGDAVKEEKPKKKQDIVITEEANIECYACHNCKIRKPVELLTKCRNKYVDRPFKIFQLFNMILLQKNESFHIYIDYSGDIKDLQQQLNTKNLQERHCNKYFCNFCLKGSYQTDPDADKNKKETEKYFSDKATIPAVSLQNPTKLHPVTKDWCCPWCLNECFCSRCIRTEHIFKLIALYIVYGGSLNELRLNLKENLIFNTLEEFTIPFNCIIKDGKMLIRVNRSSNGKYTKESNIESDKLHYKEMELNKSLQLLNDEKKKVLEVLKKLQKEIAYDFFNKSEDEDLKEKEDKTKALVADEPIKRKKGRPRKYPISNEKTHDMTQDKSTLQVVVKKKRGRKPKINQNLNKSTLVNKSNEDESTKDTEEGVAKPKRKYNKRKIEEDKSINQEVFIFPIGPTSVFKKNKKYLKKHLKKCIKNQSDFRIIKKATNQIKANSYKRIVRRITRRSKSKNKSKS